MTITPFCKFLDHSRRDLCTLILLMGWAGAAHAQVVFTETYRTYTEDFSSLVYGVDRPWMDNRTLPGWFYLPTFAPSSADEINYVFTHGPNGTPGLQLYADRAEPPSLRALGSLTNGEIENGFSISQVVYGFSLQNDSNSVLETLTVSFDQVQWYGGNAAASDRRTFFYSTDATDLESGTWTAVPALDLHDFQNGQGEMLPVVTARAATLENLGLKVGGTIWFRWVDQQSEGGNAGAGLAALKVSAAK